jgi:hypothetical protein
MAVTRRTIIRSAIGVVALGATGGAAWLAMGPRRPEPGIASSLLLLDELDSAGAVTAQGAWSAVQVFHHLAQSVEMSVHGFPEHKSDLFKHTAGAAAFAVFRRRGRMHHALDEPIPGAPGLSDDGDVAMAIDRLRRALVEFDAYSGILAPHFAYGALTREQYAVAHAMHLNNHMRGISVR